MPSDTLESDSQKVAYWKKLSLSTSLLCDGLGTPHHVKARVPEWHFVPLFADADPFRSPAILQAEGINIL